MYDDINTKPVDVLMVEDDSGDVDLTMEVLDTSNIRLNIQVVSDGVQAMNYLHRRGDFSKASRPDLVLLDLNMPRKCGREVLSEIKNDKILRSIPIIILTTSDADEDIMNTYLNGASCYITKPVGLKQFQKVVEAINDFWFSTVKFPGRTY